MGILLVSFQENFSVNCCSTEAFKESLVPLAAIKTLHLSSFKEKLSASVLLWVLFEFEQRFYSLYKDSPELIFTIDVEV